MLKSHCKPIKVVKITDKFQVGNKVSSKKLSETRLVCQRLDHPGTLFTQRFNTMQDNNHANVVCFHMH